MHKSKGKKSDVLWAHIFSVRFFSLPCFSELVLRERMSVVVFPGGILQALQ